MQAFFDSLDMAKNKMLINQPSADIGILHPACASASYLRLRKGAGASGLIGNSTPPPLITKTDPEELPVTWLGPDQSK